MAINGNRNCCVVDTVHRHRDFLTAVTKSATSKRDLAANLSVSEKTIYRRSRELRENGLVHRTKDGFILTELGQKCIGAYQNLEQVTGFFSEYTPITESTVFGHELPNWLISSGEITRPDSGTMKEYEILQRRFKEADSVCGVIGVARLSLASATDTLQREHVDASFVIGDTISQSYRRELLHDCEGEDSPRLELLDSERDGEINLLIFEGASCTTLLLFYDTGGNLRFIFFDESNFAFQWAKDVYSKLAAETGEN
ncbi:hypothetical protein [Haloarchaeobius sp. TZWWS8]|uniref:hypothetical protein n=1 Tax=Haloarchaeobius sp. TZWWS8 TaxID=3446121 RepID=UPI003EBA1F37